MSSTRRGGWNSYINNHHTKNRNGRRFELPTTAATRTATTNDIYWAAGFLEGEGSFIARRVPGAVVREVACQQAQEEPLARLREFFGGRIYLLSERPRRKPCWTWKVSGSRAMGVMMTLYPIMSPRRQEQIVLALSLHRFDVEVARGYQSFS